MAGVNKVIIVGNLGNDPEVNYGQSGSAVTRISVATSDQWTDKNTGQKQERTEWHRVVFFGRLAEIAGEYLRKGSQVYVEGSLRTDKYTDKQGIEKYSTDIIAREMKMLGSKGGDSGGGFGGQQQQNNNFGQQQGGGQQGGYAQQQGGAPQQGQPAPMQQPAQPQNQQPQQHSSAPAPSSDFDDDIPF